MKQFRELSGSYDPLLIDGRYIKHIMLPALLQQCKMFFSQLTTGKTRNETIYIMCGGWSRVNGRKLAFVRKTVRKISDATLALPKLEKSLTSHQIHFRSYWGRVFTGKMTRKRWHYELSCKVQLWWHHPVGTFQHTNMQQIIGHWGPTTDPNSLQNCSDPEVAQGRKQQNRDGGKVHFASLLQQRDHSLDNVKFLTMQHFYPISGYSRYINSTS